MPSSKACRLVSFSPDTQQKPPAILLKQGKRSLSARIFTFRLPKSPSKYSPARILRRLGSKVARAVHLVAMRRKQSSSRKVSSSTSLTRSRSVADAIDSQRAEAIEDCIEFLNCSSSSSSLQRSNSVSSVSNL